MVVKQYNNVNFERCKKEAVHEAQVIQDLGDHPGMPVLFGVVLKNQPANILKFYMDGNESLTLFKAAKKEKMGERGMATNLLLCCGCLAAYSCL